jgi:formylglycine-generating enzyme required for sulfatase activity
LLPADAQVNDDVKLLEKTAIEVADIKEMIREKSDGKGNITGVSQVVILLDACRNDPTSGRDLSVNPMTKAYDFNLRNSGVQAFVTLYATSVGNRAYEDASRQQGYFIGEVVEALNGAAANERGEITLEKLIEHVEDKVPTKVSVRLGREQKPFHEIEGYRSGLVLALANRTAPVVVNTPPPKPEVLMAKVAGPPVPLVSFGFTTAQIDARGNVTKLPGRSALGFTEDINGLKLEMVELLGGTFTMGSPASEQQRDGDEVQHQVTVSGFYMGKYEVTQAQWQAVMGTNPSSFKHKDDLPAESVSWEEAVEFCRKLSAMTGREYRLPTEAEWEYAARAGTTAPFAFGATITPEVVMYDGNYPYANAAKGPNRLFTSPVGNLGLANSFGLYDLHGNVWEWCSDWYGNYASGSQTNPTGATSGQNRVLRGGSWSRNGSHCRSAVRYQLAPGGRGDYIGFRVVVAARTL